MFEVLMVYVFGSLFVGVTALASLAHHRDVKESESGINQITVSEMAEAARQAQHFCDSSNKNVVYVDGNPNYPVDIEKRWAAGDHLIKFKCEKKKTLLENL